MERFLERQADIAVVATLESAEAILKHLPELNADIAIVDISLPGMNGIDLVAALRERQPALNCLILSGHTEPDYVQRALAAGASGYMMKGKPALLIDAIQQIMAGEIYISEELRR
jgi:DNA-binding NarL/FixJ family response regulator